MDIANVVAALKEQRTRIDHAIAALEGLGSPARRGRPPKTGSTTGRHMSAAARKRISEAMKQRWAKWKRKSAPKKSAPAKTKARPGDERCGQEEVVGLDESPLGREEEVRLARFPSANHWHSCQRIQDFAQVATIAWTLSKRDRAHTSWCFHRDRPT